MKILIVQNWGLADIAGLLPLKKCYNQKTAPIAAFFSGLSFLLVTHPFTPLNKPTFHRPQIVIGRVGAAARSRGDFFSEGRVGPMAGSMILWRWVGRVIPATPRTGRLG
jgi:hypothetical protein